MAVGPMQLRPGLSLLRFGALTEAQKERCYFFGSFNPVTGMAKREAPANLEGHVDLAVKAQKQLGFKEMVFVPVFAAPHKDNDLFASFRDRVTMLWKSFQGSPGLVVSEIEKTLPPPSFTVQTLRALVPGFGRQKEKIPFLIGADALNGLNKWKEGKLLAKNLVFVASPRDGEAVPKSMNFDGEEVPLDVELVKDIDSSTSSTTVRKNIAEDKPVTGLVAPEVEAYIREKNLYKRPTGLQKLWKSGMKQLSAGWQLLCKKLGFKPA